MSEYEPLEGECVRIVDVKRREDMDWIGQKGIVVGGGRLVLDRGPHLNLSLCVVEKVDG